MATSMEEGCTPATVREERIIWSAAATVSLIKLWEDNLSHLRDTAHNAKVYAWITADLNAGLPSDVEHFTTKQVRLKMENLNKK
ncbi:hypothetical protein HPB49_021998 [Dermacentor silvarum]|uniref:Uncharacterized protein n=1 Tax=Dermacentor silvarum TaxID=543639 RepID=A0ACB8D861_DERSI|nr:hypothetical protein HPB49_021998 [Dermacentor silvarum]